MHGNQHTGSKFHLLIATFVSTVRRCFDIATFFLATILNATKWVAPKLKYTTNDSFPLKRKPFNLWWFWIHGGFEFLVVLNSSFLNRLASMEENSCAHLCMKSIIPAFIVNIYTWLLLKHALASPDPLPLRPTGPSPAILCERRCRILRRLLARFEVQILN